MLSLATVLWLVLSCVNRATMQLLCFTLFASASSTTVTPLQKVVEMLGGMLAKSKEEKHEEVVRFNTFKQWCDDTNGEKRAAIDDENKLIAKLTSRIEKDTATIAHLEGEIARLNDDLASFAGDLKAAKGIRRKDHEDFKAQHKDYSESIDALERGMAALKANAHNLKQGEDALLQLQQVKSIPQSALRVFEIYLQTGDDGVPEANAYESQTGGVQEVIQNLRRKFEDERLALEKAEAEEKYKFEMTSQGLHDNIEQSEEELNTKTEDMQKTKQRKASDEKELTKTQQALAEDSSYLQDTETLCLQKAQAYENRQVTRQGEIEAIEKALEILNSDDVKGSAEKHLPKLIQKSGVSFAQLRSVKSNDEAVAKAVELLQAAAKRTGSTTLLFAAEKAMNDPFKKVKHMIAELITRLMNEANEEATHKGFCDTELGMNKNVRDEKTSSVDKLTAEVEERNAKDNQLKNRLAKLTEDVSELNKAMASATAQRNTEHEKNTETIADAKAGQKAVAQALEVLKAYYAKAAAQTDLMQGPADDAPATFDEAEQGQQGAATGVIGMLEVVLSDFTRLDSETSEDESTAQSEYDNFMNESKEDKAVKEMDIDTYTGEQERNARKLHDAENELADEQAELDTALGYYEELKVECVKQPISYEERVAQRKEEVESLRQALQVLGGDSNILDSQGA
mmetsp:Transcript_41078/g.89550  ORF Transcript_41078/g.89550 Transcript_41078/m.89550 type:complete len:684 (+) Transcript_41078:496-2547(+)